MRPDLFGFMKSGPKTSSVTRKRIKFGASHDPAGSAHGKSIVHHQESTCFLFLRQTPSQYRSEQSCKKTGVPKLQCIFLGFKYSAAFFSSVHLSSRCPITSEPGLLNATQTDSQEACLLNRVLATTYPQNYRFLAAQEEWRKHRGGMLILASLFAPGQKKKG